jgi:hypothetical protein
MVVLPATVTKVVGVFVRFRAPLQLSFQSLLHLQHLRLLESLFFFRTERNKRKSKLRVQKLLKQ